jgi:uncharacterized protein (TIGR02722 family)
MIKINKGIAMLASLMWLNGCGMTNAPVVGSGKVSYGDANAVETVNTDFGSTDLNMVAQTMADDLIKTGALNGCKTYTVSAVRNKTDQYIDTETITQSIKTRLMKSNLVTSKYVLSQAQMQNQTDELSRQNNSGLYKDATKMGQMKSAQCRLDGFVSSISKTNADMKDVFYQFNMSLIQVDEGTELWVNEKQIRKTKVN